MECHIMAKKDSTAEVQTSGIKGVCDTNNIMMELWKRAAPTLTKEELSWFSNACDLAESATISLQESIVGIGCLIYEDGESGTAGNFQSSKDVPDLLFHIANSLDQIRGLNNIGMLADHRIEHFKRWRDFDNSNSNK